MADDFYRPQEWDAYVGQPKLKTQLNVAIQSAKNRGATMDHVLLCGPPGCGKTTISAIIAEQLGVRFESFVMPIKPNVLKQVVSSFHGVVLFDEIHRLPPAKQEEYLPLIEDGYLQMPNGGRIYNDNLVIVGATTERDKIIEPLYDRFVIKPTFEEYTDDEMADILRGMAASMDLDFTEGQARMLSRATAGVPRQAKMLVAAARDLAAATGWETFPTIEEIFTHCRITPDGLQEEHLEYLNIVKNCGGTAGLQVITTHLQLPKSIVMHLEKLLLKRGLIQLTKGGRELTSRGWQETQGSGEIIA